MERYDKLVEALRRPDFVDAPCSYPDCKYLNPYVACKARVVLTDAAAAIEALQAENETLHQHIADLNEAFRAESEKRQALEPKRGEMVEVVRCRDCDSWDTEHSSGRKSLGNYVCICQEWSDGEDARWVCTGEDEFCSRGERRAKMEVQDGQA